MKCDRHDWQNETYLTESRSLEATPFLLQRADTHILLIPTLAGWGVVLEDKNRINQLAGLHLWGEGGVRLVSLPQTYTCMHEEGSLPHIIM